MDVQSAFKSTLRDVTDWCCVIVSRQENPHYLIERNHYGLKDASYTLYDAWRNFSGIMIVNGGNNPLATFIGPQLYGGFLQECIAADTKGNKFSALLFACDDEPSGYDIREDPVRANILSRIWDKAHIPVANFVKEDGMLNNKTIEYALCKIGSAYRKALWLEPFVNPVKVPKFRIPAKANSNPVPRS